MNIRSIAPIALPALAFGPATSAMAQQAAPSTRVESLLARDLPGIPGKEVVMLTVEYPPGAGSDRHRHDANTFVYVLEGAVVMQVEGGQEVILERGQTFYESPSDIHAVSRNASDTQPAKFLVFFVKDQAAPASVPLEPDAAAAGSP